MRTASATSTSRSSITYGLDWTPTSLTMFVNGSPCLTDWAWLHRPAPFNQPFVIALSPGSLGVNGDAVTSSTPFPDTTQISWVLGLGAGVLTAVGGRPAAPGRLTPVDLQPPGRLLLIYNRPPQRLRASAGH